MNGIIFLKNIAAAETLNISKNRLRCHFTDVLGNFYCEFYSVVKCFLIILGDKFERDSLFCLLFTFSFEIEL